MFIDPRLAIIFATVADHRSFSMAADRLGLSTTYVSTQMRRMQSQLGLTLLVRSVTGVGLTDEGLLILPAAQRLAAAYARADVFLQQSRVAIACTLRIGCPRLTNGVFGVMVRDADGRATSLLERFLVAQEGLGLEVVHGFGVDLRAALRNRELDVAVGFLGGASDLSEFELLPLNDSVANLIAPLEHPLSRSEVVTLDMLAGCRVATFPPERDAPLFRSVYGPLIEHGAEPVSGPEGSHRSIERFAALRRILALKWRPALRARTLHGDMVELPIAGSPIRCVLALHRRWNEHNRLVDELWSLAKSLAPAGDASPPAVAREAV